MSKAIEIVKVNVKEVIEKLNKAFADEWLAYYQYWIGAKVVSGKMSKAAVGELEEHAGEELKHAEMLASRILQLKGTPILKPEDWYKMTNCGYEAPTNFDVKVILEQNIKGERCAIGVYSHLVDFVKDKDVITHKIVLDILEDEIEHEFDLQNILDEIKGL